MINDRQPTPEPIAVDPAYRLRDNQFWYSDCSFADIIRDQDKIRLRITGLGVRILTHAAAGRDGRTTYSFTLPNREDRQWWNDHRSELVRVELLALGAHEVESLVNKPIETGTRFPRATAENPQGTNLPDNENSVLDAEGVVLCIGLDIAWFGGSARDKDSQYDCLAAVRLGPGNENSNPQLNRVSLKNRDPEAIQLLEAIDIMLHANQSVDQVILALDAPIQAETREHLDVRTPLPTKGMVERRASEKWLSDRRQEIDQAAGGANGWHPNIQPGAPIAPRVGQFLDGLAARGFELWVPNKSAPARLVIECFPAEAIWAMKRMGFFQEVMTAAQVKAYKSQQRKNLNGDQVQTLVKEVLGSFGTVSVGKARWNELVDSALAWMLDDQTWQTPEGQYRGGKLLDDVVDTMICLATSLSYLHRKAHVWFDADHPNDGHIVGPGFQDNGWWNTAWSTNGQ